MRGVSLERDRTVKESGYFNYSTLRSSKHPPVWKTKSSAQNEQGCLAEKAPVGT